MAIATRTPQTGELRLPLDEIHVPGNVRDLDPAHVDALAQSIALRGLLVPLIVRQTERGFELVAGYHRIAACRQLGHHDAPVVVREHEGSSADSASENVVRKQLTPLEEARAVQAMLDEGYTLDGAAQALGWTRQLASARAKILKLPPVAQQLVGTGEIPVSAVENLLSVAAVSPALAQAAGEAITAGDLHGPELVNNPSCALGRAAGRLPKGSFARYLDKLDPRDVKALRLGKKLTSLVAEAERLHKQVEQYAYGPPPFAFSEQDVDQARAAGVLVEFGEGRGGYGSIAPLIVDQQVYRELARQVIPRTVDELQARLAAKGKRKTTTAGAGGRERSPREQLDSEHRVNLRELTRQAHAVNLDLGSALLNELSTVAVDMSVARFFALGLLGPESSSYLGSSDHAARTIAANGLRLVLEEHRTTTTPTLKSGKPGRTKVAYADVDQASKWLWKFIDGATTAGELFGRALVVYAAQHYACQLVLPAGQRRGSVLPYSHKNTARKAFEQLTKGVLPASYLALQRALAAEARTYERQVAALDGRSPKKPAAGAATVADGDMAERDVEDVDPGEEALAEDHDGEEDPLDDDDDGGGGEPG
jgi:ParB/RepB/Spo0J family partition protein